LFVLSKYNDTCSSTCSPVTIWIKWKTYYITRKGRSHYPVSPLRSWGHESSAEKRKPNGGRDDGLVRMLPMPMPDSRWRWRGGWGWGCGCGWRCCCTSALPVAFLTRWAQQGPKNASTATTMANNNNNSEWQQ